ncbi:MAG: hypothetical protein KKC58_11505 [Gammaproteobacteria bacterium]|nr:hypothetical protein [Gammaproteobacteria bacterium]
MKNFGFILLMMLLPLQSAWAAVLLYHSHGSGDSLADVVFHNHLDTSHSHTHTHGEHAHVQGNNTDQSDPDEANTTDHHHHFHVHTVSVLSEVNVLDFPLPSAVQLSSLPAWQETLFSQRIERPNWR